jgi:hypothetical protein
VCVFAISVVIMENDLENKIIHVLSLSNTLYIKFSHVFVGHKCGIRVGCNLFFLFFSKFCLPSRPMIAC